MKHIRVCKMLLLLSTLFVFTSPTQASEEDVIFKSFSDAEMQAVADYWTEERINEAVAFPLPHLDALLKSKDLMEKGDKAGESKATDIELEGANVSGESPQKADVKQFPFSTGGKLFFVTPKGVHFHCTAEFVSLGHGASYVLMTAAHCLSTPYSFKPNSNFMFYRAFNGEDHGQRFGVKCYAISPGWVKKYSFSERWQILKWDYAFLHTKQSYEQSLKLEPRKQLPSTVTAIGYPKNYGDGNFMFSVDGEVHVISYPLRAPQVKLLKMLNNTMGEGSSGGVWIDKLSSSSTIGLNSWYDNEGNMYSPIFDNKIVGLYESVMTKCPD